LLVDVSGRYYGINLQKKAEFKKQSLVASKRTTYLEKQDQLVEEKKKLFGQQFMDKKAILEAARRILEENEEDNDDWNKVSNIDNNHQDNTSYQSNDKVNRENENQSEEK
jgi:hypothetical protein